MLTKNSFVNYPKSRNNQGFSVESANFSNLCIPTIPKTYDTGFFVKKQGLSIGQFLFI